VARAAGGLLLACGGATREMSPEGTAGAASGAASGGSAGASTMMSAGAAALAGRGGSPPSGVNATAGAPVVIGPSPRCFTYDELPDAWYGDNAAGASGGECPVADG
jgi:hypothetical protein